MEKTEQLQAIKDLAEDLETGLIGIDDLDQNLVTALKRLIATGTVRNCTGEADTTDIIDRLLDSEEHATEAAIPAIAEEAAEEIRRLSVALTATQTALSQSMQHAEKADRFVADVAALSIWGYDRDDGTPYQEIEEPDDENDSHDCLMGLIERARGIYETTKGESHE